MKNTRHRIPQALRQALWERCRGRCEYAGCAIEQKSFDAHHRKQRSLGGEDTLDNVVAVCRRHHDRVHQANRYDTGWLVRGYADPWNVPIVMFDGTFYLGRGGGVTSLAPPPPDGTSPIEG